VPPIRVQKIIADAGLASRREAEVWIREGRVKVNGQVVGLGDRADPEGRNTVLDLLPPALRGGVKPVGRLDVQTEGLLLLTNDGDLAALVTNPSTGCPKEYSVKVSGVPTEPQLEKLRRGIPLDGRRTRPAEIVRSSTTARGGEGNTWLRVVLKEGRTRQIRRMFEAIGHPVSKLKRVAIGPIRDDRLPTGAWRPLSQVEVEKLRGIDRGR
jgi:pseudouridine synthase